MIGGLPRVALPSGVEDLASQQQKERRPLGGERTARHDTHARRRNADPSPRPTQVPLPGTRANLVDDRHSVRALLPEIQRLGGNAAAARVARSGLGGTATLDPVTADETAPDLLTPAQVIRARSFYASNPAQFTADVIREIQHEVGVPVDGIVGPVTIQGVARWQADNSPLEADGMAGSRTLTVMFPFGLSDQEEADTFSEEAADVRDEWGELDADERAARLADAANDRLAAAGVPACVHELVELAGTEAGQFDFTTWTLRLGSGAFSLDEVTPEQALNAARTVYHEARHAEQWFQIARYLAGRGRSAAQIRQAMTIPAHVAAAAAANPLRRGSTESVVAEGWYQSVYGSQAAARNRTLDEVRAASVAFAAARDAHEAEPTPETEAALTEARERFERAHAAYSNLPEEFDAFHVMDKLHDAHGGDLD